MRQLSEMVSMQGEWTSRIDANIDVFSANVDEGQRNLLSYMKSLTGSRWLMVKVFLITLIFFFIFVVFAMRS